MGSYSRASELDRRYLIAIALIFALQYFPGSDS